MISSDQDLWSVFGCARGGFQLIVVYRRPVDNLPRITPYLDVGAPSLGVLSFLFVKQIVHGNRTRRRLMMA